jgi:hypothetical protein
VFVRSFRTVEGKRRPEMHRWLNLSTGLETADTGCDGGFGVGSRLIIRPNSAFEDCVSGADPRNFIRLSALSSDISIWTHAA